MELWQWIAVLTGAILMLWFSFSVLIVGKILYGSDATLLWASGILLYMGFRGLMNVIVKIWEELF